MSKAGEYVYGTDESGGHWLTGEEIVRCRDCAYFSDGMGTHVWLCERMEYLDLEGWTKNVRVEPEGYCKWGERRADG